MGAGKVLDARFACLQRASRRLTGAFAGEGAKVGQTPEHAAGAWHNRTEARGGASEGPYGPTHEPAQGGLSTQLLFDDPAIGIDDSSPHLRATAHRQATPARILPLP